MRAAVSKSPVDGARDRSSVLANPESIRAPGDVHFLTEGAGNTEYFSIPEIDAAEYLWCRAFAISFLSK